MKQQDDRFLLAILAVTAVLVICFCGLVMEYGWFGYGAMDPASSDLLSGTVSISSESGYSAENDGTVYVNRATAEELDTLPGIGPVLAERIIDYREANGDFRQPEDLLAVKGIGEKVLEKIRPYLNFE